MILIYLSVLLYILLIIWLLDGYKNLVDYYAPIKIIKSKFVSIVVAARNEEKNISALLECLNKQKYKKMFYEIIIVNDKSCDNTLAILDEYKTKINNLKIINITNTPKDWSSKKWALYKGIQASVGEIIIQTDADCTMGENWLQLMIEQFNDDDIGFVASLTPMYSNKNIFEKLLMSDSIAQDAISACAIGKGIVLSCTARSMAFRKKHFNDIDGYKNIYNIASGDDDLLLHKIVYNIGCRVKYVIHKDAAVSSYPPTNIHDFINQRFRFASKGLLYFKHNYISREMKIILPIIFLTNLMIIISIIFFCNTLSVLWIMPFLFKTFVDFLILYTFQKQLEISWSWLTFFLLAVLHPYYIVFFGAMGPFRRVIWK